MLLSNGVSIPKRVKVYCTLRVKLSKCLTEHCLSCKEKQSEENGTLVAELKQFRLIIVSRQVSK